MAIDSREYQKIKDSEIEREFLIYRDSNILTYNGLKGAALDYLMYRMFKAGWLAKESQIMRGNFKESGAE